MWFLVTVFVLLWHSSDGHECHLFREITGQEGMDALFSCWHSASRRQKGVHQEGATWTVKASYLAPRCGESGGIVRGPTVTHRANTMARLRRAGSVRSWWGSEEGFGRDPFPCGSGPAGENWHKSPGYHAIGPPLNLLGVSSLCVNHKESYFPDQVIKYKQNRKTS